jgi:hypothetical protein
VDPNNGNVLTAVKFDREALTGDRSIPVTVKAADQGVPQSLDSHCTFWVQIGDVNDNSPVFDSPSYATSISESSATVGRRIFAVRASDRDHGQNANIMYSLTDNPGEFFRIESDTGIIYLDKSLHGVSFCIVWYYRLNLFYCTLQICKIKVQDKMVPNVLLLEIYFKTVVRYVMSRNR